MKKLILTALAIVGLQGVSIQGAASAQAAAFGAKAWNFMQGMNAVAIPIIGAGLGYNWYQSNEIAKPVAAKVGQAVEQVGQIAHSMNQAEIFRGILSQLAVQAMIKHSNFLENYGIKLTDEHKKFFNIQPEKDLSNWDKAKNVGKWFDSKLIGGASKIQAYLGIIS